MFTIYELKKTDVQAWCHWKTCISKRTALVSSIFGNEYSGIYTLQFDMILWEHIRQQDDSLQISHYMWQQPEYDTVYGMSNFSRHPPNTEFLRVMSKTSFTMHYPYYNYP